MTDMAKIPISLEFFPPKTPEGVAKLAAARQALYALSPEFCSVTYGAGGSTRARTHRTVRRNIDETGIEPAAHHPIAAKLPDEELARFLATLRDNVSRTVAGLPPHAAYVAQYCGG